MSGCPPKKVINLEAVPRKKEKKVRLSLFAFAFGGALGFFGVYLPDDFNAVDGNVGRGSDTDLYAIFFDLYDLKFDFIR